MDRTLEVRTPESIAFSYELAGIGSRFLAVTIDLVVQLAILLLLLWGMSVAAPHLSFQAIRAAHGGAGRFVQNLGVALLVVVLFLIFFGYFILFEAFAHGQTPGKRMLGIRVVRDGGYPVDFMAALIRNLIRVAEALLGYYAVSAVVAVASPQNKRIGDMAAGTIVVREARMESPQAMLREVAEPVYAATAYVSGEERSIIRRFLERRTELVEGRRAAIARQLAERVRPRVPLDLQRLADEDLLERL
ncbi:MAG TPA: RDD family protein [Candidatus Baltobacteraceae bacterium]|nr:RDD family protein [Candidatus Baltobacteraceae bacterium]